MFKLSKYFSRISISAILIACLIPNVFAQAANTNQSQPTTNQLQVIKDQPWLVTIVHEINLSEIRSSLLKRGIKTKLPSEKLTKFQPTNVTTGIVVDQKGHILTKLVNLIPEAGEQAIGTINVVLPSGEQKQARFVGLDGPSGFCLLAVDNLNIKPVPLANNISLVSNDLVTLLNVEFEEDKSNNIPQFNRSILAQNAKILQFPNQEFFSIDFSNNVAGATSLSFGVVINNNKEVVGIPNSLENNVVEVFSAIQARRIAKRIIDRQGNIPRGWLGVNGFDCNKLPIDQLKELGILDNPKGFYVRNIIPNSPASISGLQENDVIINLNGRAVESDSQLYSFIALQPAGETITFDVLRNKKLENIKVILGERGYKSPFVEDSIGKQAYMYSIQQDLKSIDTALQNFQSAYSKANEASLANNKNETSLANNLEAQKNLSSQISLLKSERLKLMKQLKRFNYNLEQNLPEKFLGVKLSDLPEPPKNPDPTKAQKFPHGVLVVSILPNSLAERSGIKVGDVLVQMSSYLIDNKENFSNMLLSIREAAAITECEIVVTRNNEEVTLKLDLAPRLPKEKNMPKQRILTEEERQKLK
ncbi:MAG: PDZ domain-containing protein [Blastocatellia bacterium]|nr:PDZ domain-containing protein [Blastocatellia bacterium]MBN8721437.1 PDZ domain-containing protein [Acidobacteriota bacterium]